MGWDEGVETELVAASSDSNRLRTPQAIGNWERCHEPRATMPSCAFETDGNRGLLLRNTKYKIPCLAKTWRYKFKIQVRGWLPYKPLLHYPPCVWCPSKSVASPSFWVTFLTSYYCQCCPTIICLSVYHDHLWYIVL